jgi:hypothetical protein
VQIKTRIAGILFTVAAITAIGATGAGAATATAEPSPATPAAAAPNDPGCVRSQHGSESTGGRSGCPRTGWTEDTVESWSDGAGRRISAAHHQRSESDLPSVGHSNSRDDDGWTGDGGDASDRSAQGGAG